MSLRDLILAAEDLKREPVEVPEWGITVHVRTLTGTERDQLEAAYKESPDRDVRSRLVVASVCDEAGQAVFAAADVALVGKKSGKVLDRLCDVAMRLNGIGPKAIAELEGNS